MSRREWVIRSRVAMLTQALEKARYLTYETDEERTPKAFREFAANLLADLMHLGVMNYKIEIDKSTVFETEKATLELLQEIARMASRYFSEDNNP